MKRQPKNIESYAKHYDENHLWTKIKRTGRKAGARPLYAVLLLYYVLQSPDVPKADKAKIYGALGYFILPLDLLPDVFPIIGYTDDFSALLWALHAVWINITPAIKEKARMKLYDWLGNYDDTLLEEVDKSKQK
ncbi:MAG: DUF1232 domain-containing protein [Mediterranea massiliensis]|nr:DUF1232 domain-containing protein [Mediterranea massiliensis]